MIEMSRPRFEELVSEALDLIPEPLAIEIDNVVVMVEDEPDPDEPDLLGLYTGTPLTDRGDYGAVMPDRIDIYRGPILRMCETEAQVVEEVAITVIHEVAHHFGIDDQELHRLGWA